MASKHIIVAFLFINVILYTAADKLTSKDLDQIKSAWTKVEKNPVQYAKVLTGRLVDEVAVPIATETLELLGFILNKGWREKIVNVISQSKILTTLPQFSDFANSITKLIAQTVIPNMKMLIGASPEEFLTNYIEMFMEIGLQIYHSCLERSQPVLHSFMSKDWSAAEIAAVDKVITLLKEVDKDMIKKVISSII